MPEIQMPKLSDTMTEGTLVAGKRRRATRSLRAKCIAEIETDKATMEWESPEDGVLTEIYVEEGGKVNVGDKIAFIGEEGEEAPAEEEASRRRRRRKGEGQRSSKEVAESPRERRTLGNKGNEEGDENLGEEEAEPAEAKQVAGEKKAAKKNRRRRLRRRESRNPRQTESKLRLSRAGSRRNKD